MPCLPAITKSPGRILAAFDLLSSTLVQLHSLFVCISCISPRTMHSESAQSTIGSADTNPSLNVLPDEIVQHILYYLSPHHVAHNIQRISKRFESLGREPLLWKHHCRVDYKYWDPKHRIRQRFSGAVADVDWKALYKNRSIVDFATTKLLDSIINCQTNRINKFAAIAGLGYDVKDTLLRHCHTSEDAEDVLARRSVMIDPPYRGGY